MGNVTAETMPEDQFWSFHAATGRFLVLGCRSATNAASGHHNQSSVWYPDTAEPVTNPAQKALDEFIARRMAKRQAPAPISRSPISDWERSETESALARAMRMEWPR